MAQYCYMIKPARPTFPSDATDAERATIGVHFDYLKGLLAEGTVIFVGRCLDATFGITVYEAASDEDAAAIMHNDPAVRAGIMTAMLHPFRTALMRGM